MLRAVFALGALVIVGAWILALIVPPLVWWVDDMQVYAGIVLWALILAWVAAMVGVIGYRVVRYFAKPSY